MKEMTSEDGDVVIVEDTEVAQYLELGYAITKNVEDEDDVSIDDAIVEDEDEEDC